MAVVQTAIFIGVASVPYFGLQLSNYWWMCIPVVFVGTLAFLSIGLLAGSFTKTPEAASAIANLIVLPMAFLSGAFFPLQGAPAWLQTISQALPLRHMVDGLLAVMVRGQPPAAVLPQLGIRAARIVFRRGRPVPPEDARCCPSGPSRQDATTARMLSGRPALKPQHSRSCGPCD
jgi:ABC-type multidrug transport system permease subunit